MNAYILAAGYGTRLGNLTQKLPKCLMPVGGVPIMAYWIDNILKCNFDKIYINTHYLANEVKNFIYHNFNNERITICHETSLLGTAGSLIHSAKHLATSPTLVVHADNFSSINISQFVNFFLEHSTKYPLTMATFNTDQCSQCGMVRASEENVLTDFVEKPEKFDTTTANAAIYMFTPELIKEIQDTKLNDISLDVIPKYIGRTKTIRIDDYHIDIGTKNDLLMPNTSPTSTAPR